MLAGFVAVAVLVPSVALATHTFSDVPDGTYYTGAVEWAADNGITTGTSATTFSPDDPVTRAQNVTFAHRYDQNIVQPALAAIRQSPDRVVWVADDSSGDFLLLSAALASIGDADASNPYVVRIAPGEYTETSPVALKTYVDVEGSGQGVTTITCACGNSSADGAAATVSAGDIVAEIRHLTINNTGGDSYSNGVWTEDVVDGSVSMLHVTATATGGTSYNFGVRNASSSPSMTDVTATASGGTRNRGVYNWSSSPSMTNVTATGTDGTNSNYGVYNSSSSPSMTNVTATGTGTGGTSNYGVRNEESSPTMNNVTATATGGGNSNYGVYNYDSSSPSMTDVTATATGGTNSNYGVYNYDSSSPSMTDVTATATGGTNNRGVRNAFSSSPSIRNSSITGDDYSIYNSGTSSAHVADTMLDGTVVAGGGLACVGAYTDAFVELDSSCAVIP